jgi:hypothetical protein
MIVEYLPAPGADAASPDSSSSSIDADGLAASAAGEADLAAGTAAVSSSSSSRGSGTLLLPSYKTVKELKSSDWRPSSSKRGIIDRYAS